MYKLFIYVLGVACICNGLGAQKARCNMEHDLLQRCSMALPVLSSPDISVALTREELDKSCIGLNEGIKCINDYTEVCMAKDKKDLFRKIYTGITEVVKELCSRGVYQDEYLRHADCVKNVRPEYETCSKNYEVTLTTLTNQKASEQYETEEKGDSTHEYYLRTVCCAFQEYLLCSERTVQRLCGDQAAQFTSELLKRMASRMIQGYCLEYNEQECSYGGAEATIRSSQFVISLAVFTSVAAYAIGNLVPT